METHIPLALGFWQAESLRHDYLFLVLPNPGQMAETFSSTKIKWSKKMTDRVTLEEWVRGQGGFKKAAKVLHSDDEAIRNWVKGTSFPRMIYIARIRKLTKNRLDIMQLVELNEKRRAKEFAKKHVGMAKKRKTKALELATKKAN